MRLTRGRITTKGEAFNVFRSTTHVSDEAMVISSLLDISINVVDLSPRLVISKRKAQKTTIVNKIDMSGTWKTEEMKELSRNEKGRNGSRNLEEKKIDMMKYHRSLGKENQNCRK